MTVRARRAAPEPQAPRPRPAGRRPQAAVRSTAHRMAARRPRLGLLWIPLLALLLAGIVWINVAKLGVTTQTSRVIEQQQQVQDETLRLKNALDTRSSLLAQRAEQRLGMTSPDDVTRLP